MSGRLRDSSLSAFITGFISVLIGFASSIAIIFEAAGQLRATPEQTASWLWAIGLGMGIPTIALSLILRQPVLIAWSTAGVALVGSAASHGLLTLPEAIACFIFNGLLITLTGFSGIFARLMKHLPLPLAAALLAGVLSRFVLDAALQVPIDPPLAAIMAAAYLLGRRLWPAFNIPILLGVAALTCLARQQLQLPPLPSSFTTPVWTAPSFSASSLIGTGIPLFIVTMASQNLPGLAAIRHAGYSIPVSSTIGVTGLATTFFAPFGAFGINLAAITASFCLGPQAHPDPARRYWSPVYAGIFYLLIGLFSTSVVAFFLNFPRPAILLLAGIALIPTIGNALGDALQPHSHRQSVLYTFFLTLSGIELLGIGSAFWGTVLGGLIWAFEASFLSKNPEKPASAAVRRP